MTRTLSRALRTLAQLVAGGGASAVVAAIVDGLAPVWAAGVALFGAWVVCICQNALEAAGKVPVVFEPPHALTPPKS